MLTRTEDHRDPERGDTLVEVLVTLVIVALAASALIGGLLSSVSSSVTNRNQSTIETVLRSFADTARNAIETSSSAAGSNAPQFTACALSGGTTTAPTYKVAGSLYPSSGPVGTAVAALGLGFTSATVSSGTFNGTVFATAPQFLQSPSGNGGISIFTVPAEPQGTYTVQPFDGSTNAASQFTVTPWVGAISAVSAGVDQVHVTGFAASSQLTIAGPTPTPQTPNAANGGITDSSGSATVIFSQSGTSSVPVVISDASGNSQTVQLQRSTGTSSAEGLVSTSMFSTYTFNATYQFWNGSGFVPGCTLGGDTNLQQVTLDLHTSQTGAADGDQLSIVLANFAPETTPSLVMTCTTLGNPCGTSVALGSPLQFSATVGIPASAGGTLTWTGLPTGATCATTLPTSTCTVAAALPGTYQPTVTYSGWERYSGTAATLGSAVTVNTVTTILTVGPSASPVSSPSNIGWSAQLSPVVPAIPPSQAITWSVTDNGNPTVCAVTGNTAAGSSTCSITGATSGVYSATVQYPSGDSNYQAATGGPSSITVLYPGTPTVTPSNPNPTTGSSETFTASVPTGSGVTGPTGTITWSLTLNGTAIANPATCPTSTTPSSASCVVNNLAFGSYQATANYSGDGLYGAGSGSTTVSVRRPGTPTVSCTSPSNCTSATQSTGTQLTFTSSVATSGGTAPSGNITWQILLGGSPASGLLCAATPATGGTCKFTPTQGGSYTVTASYAGDTNYAPGSATSSSVTVQGITFVLTCSDSKNQGGSCSGFGNKDPIVYTATLTVPSGGQAPSGGKIYFTGANLPASCTSQPGTAVPGTAPYQVTCSFTADNPHGNPGISYGPVTATYTGDANYGTLTSNTYPSIP